MEVPSNMLPDPQPEEQEVVETETQVEVEAPAPELEVEDEPQEKVKPPKGYVPHEALLEERRLRKEAQKKAEEAEAMLNSPSSEPVDSALEERLARLERQSVYRTFPNLEDKREEFEIFMEENPHYPLEAGAKIFLAEHDMLDKPKRKGLERPTAGPKTAPKTGYSASDLKKMREDQPRKYEEGIKSGKINLDEVDWDK